MRILASRYALAGFGLAEILVAVAVSSAIAGALFTGAITVQRSFFAAQHFVRLQSQQMRVLDYVALDARRATAFERPASGGLTLYLPDFYNVTDPDNPQPRAPQLTSSGTVYYGNRSTPIVVKYYMDGETIVREYQGTKQVLVDGVEDFKLDFPPGDASGRTLEATVKIKPKFSQSASTALEEHNTASVTLLLRNRLN